MLKLAMYMCKANIETLETEARYTEEEWHLDIKAIQTEAGVEKKFVILMLEQKDIVLPQMLADLETLAVHGEITWRYGKEELENICVQIKFKSAALARSREDELVLEEFRSNCRKLLQWTLISSPRSEIIRIGIRRNP